MRRWLQRIRRSVRPAAPQPLILMYHRIAAPRVDPWGLAVHPDRFEAQLNILRRRRTPMTMSELVRQLDRGTLPNDAVAVTFDDGYVDNLRHAKPRLTAAGIPATLFLMAGAIGQSTEFWWDELARGILGRADELDCRVIVGGELCHVVFAASDLVATGRASWRAWEEPATERQRAYLALWRRLRDATATERDAAMNRLREAIQMSPPQADDLPMSAENVAEIAGNGLFEVGGHTMTHPVLPSLTPANRRREILEGKQVCERLANKSISGFAYPHGALDADSCHAVQECGFTWACGTAPHSVPTSGFNRYALPRLFVLDWDGAAFERALATASVRQPSVPVGHTAVGAR
jgi:peptidoglycan/xylan/chitin deacetylase (PgdA/CDA1 family)